ncbi:MAG: UDP-N-acetylmuramoyl-L-alanine--D-glutamate ligase [Planctomycetota bacterium]|jgi:UDP-N-acetylmuramoylalanine--D-glutamate ligase
MPFSGRRVTLMGLGHFGGGVAAARWLARQGAEVTVTDLADEAVLAQSLAALADVPIARFHLGGHREADFRRADVVVVNPAVRPGDRFVEAAARAGARVTSETELFLEACGAKVIGVTGSNGKSTTAAMTAAILEADGRTTHLGGNIGGRLLERVDRIGAEDRVVFELSSFQLHRLGDRVPMPEVAVVTGCSPNHLDWHPSYDDYKAAKQRILTGRQAGSLAVLNTADAETASWGRLVRGRQLPLVPDDEIPPLAVPGEHNRTNARCAATAAMGVGCRREAAWHGLASFTGLAHRLECVGNVRGRRLYDDSSSTTPDSTIAALLALPNRTWLLAGGADKGFDFRPLAARIVRRACGAVLFGAVRHQLRDDILAEASDFPAAAVESIDEALDWCLERSQPGDAILLSPACASYDQFRNYRDRAARFVQRARELNGRCKSPVKRSGPLRAAL